MRQLRNLENDTMIVGPKPSYCPDCTSSTIQFLVGRGAFCCGCGRMRGKIDDESNPWRTVNCDATPASELPRVDPRDLPSLAVADSMSGRVGPIIKHLFQDAAGAALVEYGMLVGLIAVICVVAVTALGDKVSEAFSAIAAALPTT